MKLAVIALFLGIYTPSEAQYGGSPMWDRRYEDWQQDQRRNWPPPRRYGPQMEPCIYSGDCRSPRPRLPPFRYPGPGPGNPDEY